MRRRWSSSASRPFKPIVILSEARISWRLREVCSSKCHEILSFDFAQDRRFAQDDRAAGGFPQFPQFPLVIRQSERGSHPSAAAAVRRRPACTRPCAENPRAPVTGSPARAFPPPSSSRRRQARGAAPRAPASCRSTARRQAPRQQERSLDYAARWAASLGMTVIKCDRPAGMRGTRVHRCTRSRSAAPRRASSASLPAASLGTAARRA